MKRPPTRPPTINNTGHQRHPTAPMINFTSILNLRFLIFWFKTEKPRKFAGKSLFTKLADQWSSRTGGHGPCHPQRPSGSWRSNQRRPGAGSRSRFRWRSCFVCFQRENNPHKKNWGQVELLNLTEEWFFLSDVGWLFGSQLQSFIIGVWSEENLLSTLAWKPDFSLAPPLLAALLLQV